MGHVHCLEFRWAWCYDSQHFDGAKECYIRLQTGSCAERAV